MQFPPRDWKGVLRTMEGDWLYLRRCQLVVMVSARGKWITRRLSVSGLHTPIILWVEGLASHRESVATSPMKGGVGGTIYRDFLYVSNGGR